MTDGESAHQRQSVARIRESWPGFRHRRQAQLAGATGAGPAEKVAENILCDLFTTVLDWTVEQVRLQENRVDMMLTRNGFDYLVVEAKRPGSLDGPGTIAAALRQAQGYAAERQVTKVAVSDGCVFEAHDVSATGLRPRVITHLADADPPESLWWLSTRGIYKTAPLVAGPIAAQDIAGDEIRHPKYGLPARCFALVERADRPATWKLPYLKEDGSVDDRRLPKAILAALRDYRGAQMSLPAEHQRQVLVKLAQAAVRQGRMPHQDPTPAEVYVALRDFLRQSGHAQEVPGIA